MAGHEVMHYRRKPSALAYMARAFLPSPGCRPGAPFPNVTAAWNAVDLPGRQEDAFRRATGLDGRSVLYPHVLGFRLQMAVLTSRAFPLPIWSALQIRNRLILHRPLDRSAGYAFETQVGGQRPVEKGLEVDLVTRLTRGETCDWESVVTYFYRGRFEAGKPTSPPAAPDLSDATLIERLRIPATGRLAFAALTGDYNGIHLWDAYARRFGFPAAFPHPQRVVGVAMARLAAAGLAPAVAAAQTLDLWLKGPVFYGAAAVLSAAPAGASTRFGVSLEGEARTAIAGLWREGAPEP